MRHRRRPAGLERQRRLGPIQGLTLRLLIEAKHHRPGWRVQIHPNHVDQLVLELRIIADLEGIHLPGLQPVIGPDTSHRVLPDTNPGRHRAGGPVRRPARGSFVRCGVQDALDRALRQTGLTSSPLSDTPDARDTGLGEPVTPAPHRIRVHTRPSRDHLVGYAVARPQQRPRPHHLPMRQPRRPRHPPQRHTLLVRHRQRRSDHTDILQTTKPNHRRTTRLATCSPSTWSTRSGVSARSVFANRQASPRSWTDRDWSTRRFARDAVAVLDTPGLGTAHVYDASMGGRVAQWLAVDRPGRVAQLPAAQGGPQQGRFRSNRPWSRCSTSRSATSRIAVGRTRLRLEASAASIPHILRGADPHPLRPPRSFT